MAGVVSVKLRVASTVGDRAKRKGAVVDLPPEVAALFVDKGQAEFVVGEDKSKGVTEDAAIAGDDQAQV